MAEVIETRQRSSPAAHSKSHGYDNFQREKLLTRWTPSKPGRISQTLCVGRSGTPVTPALG